MVTHPLTHSFTHPPTHSPTHSLTHPKSHLLPFLPSIPSQLPKLPSHVIQTTSYLPIHPSPQPKPEPNPSQIFPLPKYAESTHMHGWKMGHTREADVIHDDTKRLRNPSQAPP